MISKNVNLNGNKKEEHDNKLEHHYHPNIISKHKLDSNSCKDGDEKSKIYEEHHKKKTK